MVATAYSRKFVPKNLQLTSFADVEPLYRELLARDIASSDDLGKWLAELSELSAVVDEEGNRRYIAKSCHTDDKAIEAAFLRFVEEIEPRVKPIFFQLQQKFLDSPHQSELTGKRYEMLIKRWRAEVELFRQENVPLEISVTKLNNDYDKICGAMTVQLRGKEYTLQQLARFSEELDRALREEAYCVGVSRRLVDRDTIEDLFDRMLPLRQQIAHNAGLSDYRAYCWKQYKRFDYTPEDCERFADAIEQTVMPAIHELDRQRKHDLALAKLRPWDSAVDPKSRPALRPFAEDQTDLLIDKTKAIIARLSPALSDEFESLRTNSNLDLASRKGKQPGGYQATLEEVREPFIFMNAAGRQTDVETLLHEGGHAFHAVAARDEELVFLRSAPMEFCEVASMAMEAMGADHFDVIYPNPADAARAKRAQFEGVLRVLPWIATIDAFQHWIYTHPGHSRPERTSAWLALRNRFGPSEENYDWSEFEVARANQWQAQLHLFHVPFYYIEYGIAQLGALQLWLKARENPQQALANYRAALALGGTRPLPDLFAAAGIRFDFSERTLRPLVAAVADELSQLPR